MGAQLELSNDDFDLVVEFAGCSLDEKPGSNWVQDRGGLPEYLCVLARAIRRTGKSTSQAIAIAVSRAKKWAAGGDDVNADTRAKAAKAVAEWEALKAKRSKKSDKVAASAPSETPLFDENISAAALLDLVAATPPCSQTATDKVLLTITRRRSAVEKILNRSK